MKKNVFVALMLTVALCLGAVSTSFAAFASNSLESIGRTDGKSNEIAVETVAMALANDTVAGKYKLIGTEDVKANIGKAVIIDTMPAGWYGKHHIPTAINSYMQLKVNNGMDPTFDTKKAENAWKKKNNAAIVKAAKKACTGKNGKVNYNKKIIVYCGFVKCTRSDTGAVALVKAGFKNVYRYPAGISGWVDAGYEVEGTLANEMDQFK